VDLYNYAYWWECHEVFEGLWHAVGRRTMPGQFFRAIIQIAAANLKRAVGAARPAKNLSRSGLDRLATLPPVYMGLDVVAFAEAVRASFAAAHGTPPLLRLDICATE
jgi:predicted metal-dependent hydrolase